MQGGWEGDGSAVVRLPGQEDGSMSPQLSRPLPSLPSFSQHGTDCSCQQCGLGLLHRLLLRLLCCQAWCDAVDTQYKLASQQRAAAVELFRQLEQRNSIDLKLKVEFIEQLMQLVECCIWAEEWEDLDKLVEV